MRLFFADEPTQNDDFVRALVLRAATYPDELDTKITEARTKSRASSRCAGYFMKYRARRDERPRQHRRPWHKRPSR